FSKESIALQVASPRRSLWIRVFSHSEAPASPQNRTVLFCCIHAGELGKEAGASVCRCEGGPSQRVNYAKPVVLSFPDQERL
ncbi:MAG: hypothetical protein RI573_17790, partial [Balneolaceae bacterium]|nr:hypothetical protein [Balneolaceae bacterium]